MAVEAIKGKKKKKENMLPKLGIELGTSGIAARYADH